MGKISRKSGMHSAARVSIVILMHNHIPMTVQCLRSLSDAVADLDHEVIVLDNGSYQDTGPLRECGSYFRRFKLIRSDENRSFSIGNNFGARECSGRWLLFLNNDVFPYRESVRRLVAPLHDEEQVGATGGKLLFPGEATVQHAGIGQMLWDHPSNYGVGARPGDERITERRECFALSGAMLCVGREIFERTGGFDERYVWGTEDIDLCLKIKTTGQKLIYCPEAVAVHRESATLKRSGKCRAESNCRIYRQLWNPVLLPAEQNYVGFLKCQGIRRVAVFGMSSAARGLARILDQNGIQIVAFTSSDAQTPGTEFLDRPVLPLPFLKSLDYDRLMVASQYFFAVEPMIREYDPLGEPIYPLLD
jgi:GT2 family glycosyltransferase